MIFKLGTTNKSVAITLSMILFFIANLASTICVYTAIGLTASNFPKKTSFFVAIIFAVYLQLGPFFEYCLRNTFGNSNYYFIIIGSLILLTFLVVGYGIGIIKVKSKLVRHFSPDKLGVVMFIFVGAIFVECLFISKLIENNWLMGVLLFIGCALCNLLSPYFLGKMTKKEIKGFKALKLLSWKIKKFNEVEFLDCLRDFK